MKISFSARVKRELVAVCELEKNGRAAFLGMAYSLRHTSARQIGILSETREVVAFFARQLEKELSISAKIKESGTEKKRFSLMAMLREEDEENLTTLLNQMSIESLEDPLFESAWVRGAFLACGYITNPQKSYHLEFLFDTAEKADYLILLLSDAGFDFRYTKRGEAEHSAYLKESEQVEDLLTYIGATRASMEVMNVKIYKDLRNDANRKNNFDTANIEKAASAGAEQTFYIRAVFDELGKDTLDKELVRVGEARLIHPDLSLDRLAEVISPKLSRSALYRRLSKFKQLYEKSVKKEGE